MAILAILPGILQQPAIAAGPAGRAFDPADQRAFRREAQRFALGFKAPGLAPARAGDAIAWTIIPGISYTHGQDGSRTWNGPLELDASWNDDATVLSVTTNGYTSTRTDSGTSRGLDDVTLTLSHELPISTDDDVVRGNLSLIVPTHGDIGSDAAQERLGLSYKHVFHGWNVLVSGQATHHGGDVPDSTSRTSYGLLMQGTLDVPNANDTDVFGQIVRNYRKGPGGQTSIALGSDFPVSKSFGGTLTLTRGLTGGARDTSLEFDLAYQF
jgi:hypothetical protein